MEIRRITAELLRAGERHNQLLSKLTRYLGICGEAAAGIVTLPYDHAQFLRKLDELRYGVVDENMPGRRRDVLAEVGHEMAGILAQIPSLPGTLLKEASHESTLIHLRLVLSASELSLLPFEASKVPVSAGGSSENWLALSTRPPVCLTRHVRSVPTEGVKWPMQPRILFVAGPNVPVDDHLQALRAAIRPWMPVRGDETEEELQELERPWLVVERDGTWDNMAEACRGNEFTHVHILAHGAVDETRTGEPFGVLFRDAVLSGRDLASALTDETADPIHRPSVVTLATCDSAQQRQVYTPDGSVAHELHECGIPLVLSSQFPLSVEGSIPFVETFYEDQMWGVHPLHTMFRVRMNLHGRPEYHDWASVVVYEALPGDLDRQLEELRYWQARRAHNVAQKRIEKIVDEGGRPSGADYARLERARDRLPAEGRFATECVGLIAAELKRIAEVRYQLARQRGMPRGERREHRAACRRLLEASRDEYRRGVEAFVATNKEPVVHAMATLHWLAIQDVSMSAVLGQEVREDIRMAAKLSATLDLEQQDREDKAWAHGSLAELDLLSLTDPKLSREMRERISSEAEERARVIVELMGRNSEQAQFTARQFRRYFQRWGTARFAKDLGLPPRTSWEVELGLLETARRLAKILAGEGVLKSGWVPDVGKGIERLSDRTEKAEIKPSEAAPETRGGTPTTTTTTETVETSRKSASKRRKLASPKNSPFVIEMLPARNGDCLWIEYGPPNRRSRWLIDCGAKTAAKALEDRIAEAANADGRRPSFELFVLTHIDSDHISGVLQFFRTTQVEFDDIWFNGWPQLPKDHLDPKFLGVKQGEEYSQLLAKQKRPWNRRVKKDPEGHPGPMWIPRSGKLPSFELPGGMKLTLLSPRRHELEDLAQKWAVGRKELEPSQKYLGGKPPPPIPDPSKLDLEKLATERNDPDPSVANGSSIALLAEYGKKTVLLTGDAHAEVVAESVRKLLAERKSKSKRLKIDALKLSHHGSANALSKELLDVLDCPRYLVSTNGSHFYHPHREAIARVVVHGGASPNLYFNYPAEENAYSAPFANESLKDGYGFEAHFPPAGKRGMKIRL